MAEDTAKAEAVAACGSHMTYLQTNVFRYHDTFPHPAEVPILAGADPRRHRRHAPATSGQPAPSSATPTTPWSSARRWESAGADQLVFGLGMASKEETLEMIRLMGEHVIPKIDTDPVHRTTRLRQAAADKL